MSAADRANQRARSPKRPDPALPHSSKTPNKNALDLSGRGRYERMERETGLEPATLSLGSWGTNANSSLHFNDLQKILGRRKWLDWTGVDPSSEENCDLAKSSRHIPPRQTTLADPQASALA